MINKSKLKKMYDNGLLNTSILLNECKPFIIEHLQKGYSYKKMLKLLEIELKEIGIEKNIPLATFVSWKDRTNKYTGNKNLSVEEIKMTEPVSSKVEIKENETEI
jgi:hypothetical protein